MTDKPRSVLGILLLTVLIDMVGFSVIFPLFPQILEYYLNLEGAESIVGRLVATLVRIGGSEFAVVALFGGVLGSVYSLLQFLFAPVWGGLSEGVQYAILLMNALVPFINRATHPKVFGTGKVRVTS